MTSPAFEHLCSWENLVVAWRKAARGKRGTGSVARFEYRAEEHLAELREQFLAGTYCPGAYVHFRIEDSKARKISAVCAKPADTLNAVAIHRHPSLEVSRDCPVGLPARW